MREDSFKNFVLDQLQDLEELDARPMFGGYGIYQEELFFGIIFKDRLYFKTDRATVSCYRKLKMRPLRPNTRQTLKSYYEVPEDVLEDRDRLVNWARRAVKSQARHR